MEESSDDDEDGNEDTAVAPVNTEGLPELPSWSVRKEAWQREERPEYWHPKGFKVRLITAAGGVQRVCVECATVRHGRKT